MPIYECGVDIFLAFKSSACYFFVDYYFSSMKKLTKYIPGFVEIDDKEAVLILAARLYEMGKISLGQAAEMVGLTKRAFAEFLAGYINPLLRNPDSGLLRSIKNESKFWLINFNK